MQNVAENVVRSSSVVSRTIGDETLVVPVRGAVGDLASIYRFNAVGSAIWEALEKPVSREGICSLIESAYDVSREQVEQDVAAFLEEMGAAGLIEVVPENHLDEAGSHADSETAA
ncbi:MAG: PqqD family protein [Acidobacteriales bacterium]|nr:PqqD family protein [Terriglobales bacterium]